ncbi:hypothetical protein MPSEU_000594700 [Mayamaea pseudoterrestris]|nr:hypothetical protein MPSEU_000594700 [Mayamaea pseudoterrestris]
MNDYDLVATTDPEDELFNDTEGLTDKQINNDVERTDSLLHYPTGDDNDDDENGDAESQSLLHEIVTTPSMLSLTKLLHSTLLPDEPMHYLNVRLVESPAIVKFLKFITATALLIVVVYHLVRIMDYEHNPHLQLSDLYTFESNLIVQDALVYFMVGRLYKQQGIDHLAWIGWCLAANVFSINLTRFQFLQHAFTLYEIHCRWPWQLFAFVLLAAPIVVGLILMHVHKAFQERVFFVKLMELILCITLFLVPYLSSEYLHMHHWYLGWLIGMHFNVDVWWSRAAMAWCWGLYVNGIAAYGRDPVLTCGYSYWLSAHMRCPYLNCYLDELENPTWLNDTDHVEPMINPDWRNCSADSYHP